MISLEYIQRISIKFTVYFENPFWVGLFEKAVNEKLSVYKVVFAAEPKDNQILEFFLSNYYLLHYRLEVFCKKAIKEKINPKRIQKDAKKQLENIGIGTKSQQNENKFIKQSKSKEQKELEKFIL